MARRGGAGRAGDCSRNLFVVLIGFLPVSEPLRVPSFPHPLALAVPVLTHRGNLAIAVPANMLAVLHAVFVVIDRRLLSAVVPHRPLASLLAVVVLALHHQGALGPVNFKRPFLDRLSVHHFLAPALLPIGRRLAHRLGTRGTRERRRTSAVARTRDQYQVK